ncbi:MAG: ArsA family ATPase [Candidatus Lokiarchaeota archaeon]|nr:ArsA family ATPase [Candidatus Lokiarchaeota archaeon]
MELKEQLLKLKFIMFGGKGGVGKTSCASSAAIWAAENGRNTLILSTDPAHSLGDSLGLELPPGIPTPVEGIKNLTALEINPKANMSEFEGLTNVNPMESLGMSGLDEMGMFGDIQELSSMNPPGIDEALAFAKILEFIETEHDFDLIVFDTAPTGHTLRFLSLPETLSGWIGKLLKLRAKLGNFLGVFKNMFKKEKSDKDNSLEILEHLNTSILNARDDLVNPEITSFVIVMIPEDMAIAETGRLLNQLIKYNMSVSNMIINQIFPNTEELCNFCKSRRSMQEKHIKRIQEIFKNKMNKNIIQIPLFDDEIRKYPKLKEMSKYLLQEN